MTAPLAIVTGVVGAIGAAICEELSGRGWRVIGVDIAAPPSGDLEHRLCDMGDHEAVERVFGDLIRTCGPPAGLVNCAGVVRNKSFFEIGVEDFDRTMAINARGLFFASQLVTASMVEHGVRGAVVHIASIGAFQPTNDPVYGMSKAAVVLLTKAMARQLAVHGVRVNAVSPGIIETAMSASLPDEVRDKYQAGIPMGRFGEPEEIAKSVGFLLSDDASYMTGAVLNLSGGLMV